MVKKVVLLLLVFSSAIGNAQTVPVKALDWASGVEPYSTLHYDGTYLYATTSSGTINTFGSIFKLKPDGTDYSLLHSFNGTDGSGAFSGVVQDGIYLFGTTDAGGSFGYGTIYRIQSDGSNFTTLKNFQGSTEGANPYGPLILEGGVLYGMTRQGGNSSIGTIYKIMPDGTGFQKIFDFTGSPTGAYPVDALYSDGTYLYGVCNYSGANNVGTIFKILPDGTGFVKLHDFNSADGQGPLGKLISDGTHLYGTCSYGGTNNDGVFYRILPDGTDFTVLKHLHELTSGEKPLGGFLLDGTTLYAYLNDGGLAPSNNGVVCSINTDGTGFAVLDGFNPINVRGSNPVGAPISVGDFLYGMTNDAGANGYGTVFRYCLYSPVIEATATPPWVCTGNSLVLTGSGGESYTWTNGVVDNVSFNPPSSNGYIVTGIDSLGCAGTDNITVIVQPCLGEEEKSDAEIEIYPNPTNSGVTFSNMAIGSTWNLYGVNSELIGIGIIQSEKETFDLSHLANGIYYIEFQTSVGRSFARIAKI